MSVCGYGPPDGCFEGCAASEGTSDFPSQCAKAESCSYVLFIPHNPSSSEYAWGTCWVYPNGTDDAEAGPPVAATLSSLCSLRPSRYTSSAEDSIDGIQTTDVVPSSTADSEFPAYAAFSFMNPLAVSMSVLLWQSLT